MSVEDFSNDLLRKIMTYCGLLGPIVAFSAIFISTAIQSDWFTWTGKALSHLGEFGTPHAWFFNLGMVIGGTLGVVFALKVFDYFDYSVSKIGSIIFLVGVFNLILVGTFPIGWGQHTLVSLLFFGLSGIGILTVGIGESIDGEKLGYLWIILFVIALILAYLTSVWFEGIAIPEMVGAIVFGIFSLVYFGRISGHL